MRSILMTAAAFGLALSATAWADDKGDPAAGEKVFSKCKSCHTIADGDNVIQKGGKTGPNLFGVVGRPAASLEDFKYGEGIKEAAEKGLIWDEENLVKYVEDPTEFLEEFTGDNKAKSKMTFKLNKGEKDIVAYLASLAPADAAAAPAK
jgi:cytochrome c